MSPAQSRMARAALRMGVKELAAHANVSPTTVTHFERDGNAYATTVKAMRQVLEAAGVEFLGDDGVRLKPK